MHHKYLNLLGMKVRDKVTNVTGVVVSLSFDLYGCLQAVVEQPVDKAGKPREQHWFDCKRLEAIDVVQLLEVPEFDILPMFPAMLGKPVRDLVSQFTGIATAIVLDLNGAVQASVKPTIADDAIVPDSQWIDCRRLKIVGSAVMPAPSFEDRAGREAGPAEKPARVSRPMQ